MKITMGRRLENGVTIKVFMGKFCYCSGERITQKAGGMSGGAGDAVVDLVAAACPCGGDQGFRFQLFQIRQQHE